MIPLGITLLIWGLLVELLLGRFHRFFDWTYIRERPEAVRIALARASLVVGGVLLSAAGLVELVG